MYTAYAKLIVALPADVCQSLKEAHGMQVGVAPEFGFAEFLDKKFEANSFDIVHMSNSLDHSFYPVLGIYQLLYVCKIGGKVILRHISNEAEAEKYKGLHQWNLDCDFDKQHFLIWIRSENGDLTEYNITELLSGYAKITCMANPLEPDTFFRVEMVKTQDIEAPQNHLYNTILQETTRFLLEILLKQIQANITKRRELDIKLIIDTTFDSYDVVAGLLRTVGYEENKIVRVSDFLG